MSKLLLILAICHFPNDCWHPLCHWLRCERILIHAEIGTLDGTIDQINVRRASQTNLACSNVKQRLTFGIIQVEIEEERK